MTLSTIGLNHKTASVEVRERLAFGEAEILPALARLRHIPGIVECVLLSTCNRTEVYLAARHNPPVPETIALLGASRGIPTGAFEASLYVHHGGEAARHVLRVASGLDSMILGEQQILGQVRRASDLARAAGATGPILNRLMQLAVMTGRRVRKDTGLSRAAPSIPRAALAQCRRVLGSLQGRRVVVVGAGDVAVLVVKVFSSAGARITGVANRTVEAAQALARRAGAEALPLDRIADAARNADALVVCVGADEPVLLRDMIPGDAGRAPPLVVIDLGVPRGVDAAAASLPGVTLFDLDGLSDTGPGPQASDADLLAADRIVGDALGAFERWMASRDAVPLIAALRRRADAIVEGELARGRSRLRGLEDGGEQAARALAEAVVRKLLHGPIVRLRESAARRDEDLLSLAKDLFDLDEEPEDIKDPGESA